MASKALTSSIALCVCFNFLFFTMFSSTYVSACPPTSGSPKSPPPPKAPKPTPSNPPSSNCPKDTLKFGVCANLLGDLLHILLGSLPKNNPKACCSLIQGLADVEVALCLCTAIKANVLGVIDLKVPINLTLLLNYCGKKSATDFYCSSY